MMEHCGPTLVALFIEFTMALLMEPADVIFGDLSMQLQNIASQESSLVRSGLQCSFVLRQAVHGCGRTFGMEMIGGLKSSMTEPIKEL